MIKTNLRKMTQYSGIKAFLSLGIAAGVMVSGALLAGYLAAGG
jgi:hypothetical protein